MTAEDQQTQPGADERSQRRARCIEQYSSRGVQLARLPVPETGPLAQSYWAKAWYENIRTLVRDAGADTSLADSAEDLARHGEVIHLCCVSSGKFSVQGIVAGEECCEACVFWPPADAKKLKELRRRTGNRLPPEDLLAGAVPKKLAALLDSPENGLLPTFAETSFYCTCEEGQAGRICTHTLALLVVLACLLNAKPELLFDLRGLQHGRFRYDDVTDTSEVLMVLHNTGDGWECVREAHADPAPAIASMNRKAGYLYTLGQFYYEITAEAYHYIVRSMELLQAGTGEDLLTSFAFVAQDGEDRQAVEMRASHLFLELLEDLAAGQKHMEDLPRLVEDFLLDAANVPRAPEERAPALQKMIREKGQEAWDRACDLMCRRIRSLLSGDFGPADTVLGELWKELLPNSDAAEDDDQEDPLTSSSHRQIMAKHVMLLLRDVAEGRANVDDIPRLMKDIVLDLLDAPKEPGERARFVRTMQAKVGWKQWNHQFTEIAAEVHRTLFLAMSSPDEFCRLLEEDPDWDEDEDEDWDIFNDDDWQFADVDDQGHDEDRLRSLKTGFLVNREHASWSDTDTAWDTAWDEEVQSHALSSASDCPAEQESHALSAASDCPAEQESHALSAASDCPAGNVSYDPPVDMDYPTGEGLNKLMAIYRDVRGGTVTDMAASLGVSPATLRRWLSIRGRISMRPSSLARVLELQDELWGRSPAQKKGTGRR